MAVSDMEALEVLDLVESLGGEPWLVGGWGVDALLERQSRVHRDVDLMIRAESLERVRSALLGLGYAVSEDWLPVRLELDDGVHVVDLHPVHDDGAGGCWQATLDGGRFPCPAGSIVGGIVGGRTVRCASPHLQVELRRGYEPGESGRQDLRILAAMLDPGDET